MKIAKRDEAKNKLEVQNEEFFLETDAIEKNMIERKVNGEKRKRAACKYFLTLLFSEHI